MSELITASSMQPIAVDAHGGDRGPRVAVEGVVAGIQEDGIKSVLVGNEGELRAIADSLGAGSLGLEYVDAREVIEMHEPPGRAVRRKPDSSLCVAFRELKNQNVSSVISMGNSGAMMAAGRLLCGLLPGIERPAITSFIPSLGERHPTIILDVGANVDCHAVNLMQFAVMGSVYSKCLFELESPRVGLLSNGSEASKGTDMIRAAANGLKQMSSVNYVGYVEGRDLAADKADVFVCDGFVGNVLLKAMEGAVRIIADQLKRESKKGLLKSVSLGVAKGVLKTVFEETLDYNEHGGAPLLGMKELGIVLHGSSDFRAVRSALRRARDFTKSALVGRIATGLSQLEDVMEIESGVLASRNGQASEVK